MAYIMRFAADNVREVVITESGHWLMERHFSRHGESRDHHCMGAIARVEF
jgi:hypothetical protein